VLATGARARTLPGLEPDGKLIWTYREAISDVVPKSLLVVGSGAIGIEFASFFRTLVRRSVEVLDRVLPVEDEEISSCAQGFRQAGNEDQGLTTVEKLEKAATASRPRSSPRTEGEAVTADRVILAVGLSQCGKPRPGKCGVKSKRPMSSSMNGARRVCRAFGHRDLVGPPWLAHKHARRRNRGRAHRRRGGRASARCVEGPGCTYCWPQVASVGMTEAKAKASGRKIKVGRFPFIGNGKAIALGDSEGLVKTVFDADTGELLGAHMIGAEVTELIQGYVVAKTGELTDVELEATIFPHPTLSEMMHEAVLDADKKALHI